MLIQKRKKQLSKSQTLFKMLQNQQIAQLTKQIIVEDINVLYDEYGGYDPKQQQFLAMLGQDPIEKIQKLLSQVQNLIQPSYELIMQEKIKRLMIHLFLQGKPFTSIFEFVKVELDEVKLQYTYQLEQSIKKFLPVNLNEDENNNLFKKLMQNSLINLFMISLSYLNDSLGDNKQLQFSLIEREKLFKISEESQELKQKKCSPSTEKIILLISEIYNKIMTRKPPEPPKVIEIIQQTDIAETPKHFVFKILLLLLVEEVVIVPELLKLFRISPISKEEEKYDKRGRLIIKLSHRLISTLCSIQEIQIKAEQLEIYPAMSLCLENDICGVREKVNQHFPAFLKITLDEAIKLALNQLLNKMNGYIHEIKTIYEDATFKDLLRKLDKICGRQIREILREQTISKQIEFEFENTNLISIGIIFFKIKNKLKSEFAYSCIEEEIKFQKEKFHKINHSDTLQLQQQPHSDKREKSVYEKQIVIWGRINPIYFKFVLSLTNQKIPFPYILKTIKMGTTNLSIHYRLNVLRDLTLKKKFRKFMKDEYNQEMTKDKVMNIEQIMILGEGRYFGKKGATWPKLINIQLQMIYENRERFTKKLRQIGKSKDFKKIIDEFNYYYDPNSTKMQLQDSFRLLNEYILSLQQE